MLEPFLVGLAGRSCFIKLVGESLAPAAAATKRELVSAQMAAGVRQGPRILLLSLVLAEGLNLQGANHMIVAAPTWNYKKEYQALGRLARAGQLQQTFHYRLGVAGAISENIFARQDIKSELENAALRGMFDGLTSIEREGMYSADPPGAPSRLAAALNGRASIFGPLVLGAAVASTSVASVVPECPVLGALLRAPASAEEGVDDPMGGEVAGATAAAPQPLVSFLWRSEAEEWKGRAGDAGAAGATGAGAAGPAAAGPATAAKGPSTLLQSAGRCRVAPAQAPLRTPLQPITNAMQGPPAAVPPAPTAASPAPLAAMMITTPVTARTASTGATATAAGPAALPLSLPPSPPRQPAPPPPRGPARPEEPLVRHARSRLGMLRSMIAGDAAVSVTVAGDAIMQRHSMASGLAVAQWRAAWGAVVGDAARARFVAQLQRELDALVLEFPGRVVFGWLQRPQASAQHVLVWAANASNFEGSPGTVILGGGQASHMGRHGPGVFGIITTPCAGLPPIAAVGGGALDGMDLDP